MHARTHARYVGAANSYCEAGIKVKWQNANDICKMGVEGKSKAILHAMEMHLKTATCRVGNMINPGMQHRCYFIARKHSLYERNFIRDIEGRNNYGNGQRIWRIYENILRNIYGKKVRKRGKVFTFVEMNMAKGLSKSRKNKLKEIVIKKNNFSNNRSVYVKCSNHFANGKNKVEEEKKVSSRIKQSTDVDKVDDENYEKNCHQMDKREQLVEENSNENRDKLVISKSLLNNITDNKICDDSNNISKELENENFDLLKYFKVENDESLISDIKPEKSKEIIGSDHFKKLMKDLNLNEEEILSLLKRSEKNVTSLINKNLTVEEIKKKAKNEDMENEKLFDTYMNNNYLKIGNFISFKKMSKKYKDVIKQVIFLLLNKEKKFCEMIKHVEDMNYDIRSHYFSILKENELFKDLNDDILTEIVKKSVLMGYLNEKFSNDIHNFEWNRDLQYVISSSIDNDNFKLKDIMYSSNSLNIAITNTQNVPMDSNEYDDVECLIKNSIEEYQNSNKLNILSSFGIFVQFS
ncbi:conserved Plasmodium protein, unknown function [Plasmodium ovale curtisi]|uniref:Uncharacterized protein n=1 Tax=Plasmodium ovale curtisi TaxID=864141 RepID=A0A1A8W8Y7_PLAOA|nr:conserved Plasmodium protein, unknown function [Plasmodium ovale curtisi]